MIVIKPVPYEKLEDVFGAAGDETNMVKISLPYPMRASWNPESIIRTFYGHRFIAEAAVEAFEEILDYFGYEFLRKVDLDKYGGCFANRNITQGQRKSVHAWGLAVDIVPHLGSYGSPSVIPYHMVRAFMDRGFMWGGNWKNPDGMHFSGVIE